MAATSKSDSGQCTEFGESERRLRASRRQFLTGLLASAGSVGVLAATDGLFAQAAFGATTGNNVVVVLSQRGGADGLSLVVPHGDPDYYAARPSINIPKANVLGLDSMFGLHPALQPLLPYWNNGSMAVVHAAGLPAPNLSHFSAIVELEDAAPGSTVRTGWINRMVGLETAPAAASAVQMGSQVVPASLVGPASTMGLPDMLSLGWSPLITSDPVRRAAYSSAYSSLWSDYSGRGSVGASEAFGAQAVLGPVEAAPYVPAATYPAGSKLGSALQDAAQLIKADVGTRVVTVDHGEWDMHANLGDLSSGLLVGQAAEFAQCVDAFLTNLGPALSRVTLISLTEFGRRVAENGDHGADHGWGGVIWAFGAGVRGGSVYGTWPGLDPASLTNGNLTVTTDYRDVLGEVLANRLATSPTSVLPGYTPTPVGMVGT